MTVLALMMLFLVESARAWADEPAPLNAHAYELAAEGKSGAGQEAPPTTDAEAAEELPHTDLDRGEAVELMNSVFSSELEGSAGIFQNFDPEHFDTNFGAVVPAADLPGEGGAPGSVLLSSTVPLRQEDAEGKTVPVDLGIEKSEGELQPANPLIEVGIPEELGEGVSMPEFGVSLELLGLAEERAPSVIDGSVAIYPNVRPETDLAIAPTPLGVETSTELRSPAASTTERFKMNLPEGASLAVEGESVLVSSAEGKPLVAVLPPTAIDAAGASVPVTMSVEGDVLTLQVHPEPGAAYPILVDPTAEGFTWFNNHTTAGLEDWTPASSSSAYQSLPYTYYYSPHIPGLDMTSGFQGPVPAGTQTNWNYYVPRYGQETPKPTSYITAMWLADMVFLTNNNYEANPYFVQGLWDGTQEWWRSEDTMSGTSGERTNYSELYTYLNESPLDEHVKAAGISLVTLAAESSAKYRTAYVGMATIALGDHEPPAGTAGAASTWANTGNASLHFKYADTGLGVQRVKAKEVIGAGGSKPFNPAQEVTLPCTGLAANPCPEKYEPGVSGAPSFEIPASNLEQGVDTVKLVASDPMGNESAVGSAQVRIDHTAPELNVGGTITEQAKLGDHLGSYGITVKAKDGSTEHPQSGVAAVEVRIDGTRVGGQSKGCGTSNCAVEEEVTIEAAKWANGVHHLEVIAEDGVHLQTAYKQTFEISHDETEPQITSSGTLIGAPEGWVEQRGFGYSIAASDTGGSGVKALRFTIDGKEVKGASASCPKGACNLAVSGEVNMAKYAGGAHVAEVAATDAAGNVADKKWEINVDPAGTVTTGEAKATSEALDGTSEATVVAPASETTLAEERASGYDPGLSAAGAQMVSTGTPDKSVIEMGKEPGFEVEAPEATLEVQTKNPSGVSSSPEIVNGVAATTANSASGVDSVIRPVYNGVMNFAEIREPGAQHSFEWSVELAEGQYLKQVDPQDVGLYFENGEEAFLIVSEPAADAVGNPVATTLTLSGEDVITLTVNISVGSYVYPVQAGTGWFGGFVTEAIPPPKTQHEKEEEERKLREQTEKEHIEAEASSGEPVMAITAPEPDGGTPPPGTATASSLRASHEGVQFMFCSHISCEAWWRRFKMFYHFNYSYAWWNENQAKPNCYEAGEVSGVSQTQELCEWRAPNYQRYGAGYHISASDIFSTQILWQQTLIPYTAYLYGDGYAEAHKTDNTCDPLSIC